VGWQHIYLKDADLALDAAFLAADEADVLFAALRAEIPWERHRLHVFGRDAPRMSCWIGDADAVYTYSRTRFHPHPWTPLLIELRDRVESSCEARFNSVLANLYRDGRDSMGWHSDDEPELGHEPVIASLSLGVKRRFLLRERGVARHRTVLELGPGSLLLMRGGTQSNYSHALPKSVRISAPRINLTFRWVLASPQPAPAASG
jgi:alkylated DNA repair dioxygenase AlkB